MKSKYVFNKLTDMVCMYVSFVMDVLIMKILLKIRSKEIKILTIIPTTREKQKRLSGAHQIENFRGPTIIKFKSFFVGSFKVHLSPINLHGHTRNSYKGQTKFRLIVQEVKNMCIKRINSREKLQLFIYLFIFSSQIKNWKTYIMLKYHKLHKSCSWSGICAWLSMNKFMLESMWTF